MALRRETAPLHHAFVATVAVVCAACSATPEATPKPVVVVPSLPPAPVTLRSIKRGPKPMMDSCAMFGPKATMTVKVQAGADELSVSLAGAPVVVIPLAGGMSSVNAKIPLLFVGRVEGLEFFPKFPLLLADGVVQLGPMSVLGPTSTWGGELIAKTVDIGPGFTLSELAVPCPQLTFVGSGHEAEEAHRGAGAPPLRSFACPKPCTNYRTPAELYFYARPGGDALVRLTGKTIVSELERRGPWVRVATQDYVHMDGAQLTGWVRLAELTRLSGIIGFTGGRSRPTPLPAGR